MNLNGKDTYYPARTLYPYGLPLADGHPLEQIRVLAYFQLRHSKSRSMRHHPLTVLAWITRRQGEYRKAHPIVPEGSAS